jgi:hypothetical protein
MGRGEIVVHNAGQTFNVTGVRAQSGRLAPSDIATLVRKAASRR